MASSMSSQLQTLHTPSQRQFPSGRDLQVCKTSGSAGPPCSSYELCSLQSPLESISSWCSIHLSIEIDMAVSLGHEAPAPGECRVRNFGMGTLKRPIQAILVFKDPDDWYLDLQIMTDVVMGGASPSPCLLAFALCRIPILSRQILKAHKRQT